MSKFIKVKLVNNAAGTGTFKLTNISDLISYIDLCRKAGMSHTIVDIGSKDLSKLTNIFAGGSLWNKLIKHYGNVRFGEVGFNYGSSSVSNGVGFTIYFK